MDTGQLLVDNYPRFLALAQAIVKNEEDAKDIVQDAVLAVLERQTIIQEPVTYCLRVVRNMSFICLKAPKYLPGYDFPDIPYIQPEDQEVLTQLRKAEGELPELLQTILELKYDKGYTIQAIAQYIHLTVPIVNRRLSKAKNFLKARITLE